MTRIDACPHCGALHAPVIVWVDGQQSLCCPDKIYVPFERKEQDDEQQPRTTNQMLRLS